jgi:hypothetical protein
VSTFKIHFLVPAEDGPIVSEPAGEPVRVSNGGRYVAACDPSLTMNENERGTGEPWGVRCKECVETDIFRQLRRPKPGRQAPETSEQVDNGCCG